MPHPALPARKLLWDLLQAQICAWKDTQEHGLPSPLWLCLASRLTHPALHLWGGCVTAGAQWLEWPLELTQLLPASRGL